MRRVEKEKEQKREKRNNEVQRSTLMRETSGKTRIPIYDARTFIRQIIYHLNA